MCGKHCLSILLLVCVPVWAQAQEVELSLRPVPAQIGGGQGVFVEVEATFPDTCTFGPEGELSFAVNIVADNRVDAFYRTADPGACGQALTFARAVFGPFPYESPNEDEDRLELSFTLERGDGLAGFGETTVAVVDEPPTATPESGFWWNPALSGHGISLDRQGDSVFGGLFSYDAAGRPEWRAFQATLQGGILTADWLGFVNGNCLLCGEPWRAPSVLEDRIPVRIAFDGPAQAWMRIGPTPGLALGLQRFHLEPAVQSGANGFPVSIPDLSGSWVKVDGEGPDAIVHASLVRIERLEDRETPGEVVFGLFESDGAAPTHTLRCSEDPVTAYGSCGFMFEAGDPGPPAYLVPSGDIGTDRIEIEGLGLTFLRVNGPD